MERCEIKTIKVHGGIGTDAWEASVNVGNRGYSIGASGRGETRQQAREALSRSVHEMMREMSAIYAELQMSK